MRIFKEEQAFRQWWFIGLFVLVFIGILLPVFKNKDQDLKLISLLIPIILTLVVFFFLFILRLKTRIDQNGVMAYFKPFPFARKSYKWEEIERIYVRQYKPIMEYGGWGIRGVGNSKAYNVSGRDGIQLHLKNGKKFLIGTQNIHDAQRVINYYQNKIS